MAGMKINYYRYAATRPDLSPAPPSATYNYKNTYFLFTPFAIAKIGPVSVQAEFNYATGDAKKYDQDGIASDVKLENISGWIDATANLGMAYVGGTVAYVSGDNPGTTDKQEGGMLTGGVDWNPCLILFNNDITYWVGNINGFYGATVNGPMSNAWFVQGRAGVKPTSQWDIMASFSYAVVDRKPKGFTNGTYGTEIDLTGTYKITDNLTYMLGVGYLFTGDYFASCNCGICANDDYMFINKLTLAF